MFSKKTISIALVAGAFIPPILAGITVNFFPQVIPYIFGSAPYILQGFKWFFVGMIMILIIGFISSFVWFSVKERVKEIKALSFNNKIKVIVIDIVAWSLVWVFIMYFFCRWVWWTAFKYNL